MGGEFSRQCFDKTDHAGNRSTWHLKHGSVSTVETIMLFYLLLFLFLTKHFIIDFLWQPEFEWRNKGTWLHRGGLIHAMKHALASLFVLLPFGFSEWIILCCVFSEFVVHYLIDFGKMNINRIKGWDANKNPEFWYLTGFDQYLHGLTYLCMIAA